MRALDRGKSFVVTPIGVPVGELIPCASGCSCPPRRPWPPSLERRVSGLRDSGKTSMPWSIRTPRRVAELAAGPHATADPAERARRQDRLQRAEATFEPLPMDAEVARAYGRVYAAVAASGRKARGRRAVDLMIAATAVAAGLPLYTRNPDDFVGLSDLLDIVAV